MTKTSFETIAKNNGCTIIKKEKTFTVFSLPNYKKNWFYKFRWETDFLTSLAGDNFTVFYSEIY